ncbi:MAG: Mpo1-like protein [Lutibacter sp.]
MEDRIKSFEEFYPFYLKQHSNKICRLLHVIGTTIVLALAFTALYHNIPALWIAVPIAGYGFAWVGHFFFEKNKPATFQYPLWSLRSDFKMYFDIFSGKIPLDPSK